MESNPTLPDKTHEFFLKIEGDDLHIGWVTEGLNIFIYNCRIASEGIACEIDIHSTALGRLHWGRINLFSASGRDALVRKLRSSYPLGTDWVHVLDQTFYAAAEHIRSGTPITQLTGSRIEKEKYLIDRLLPLYQTSIIFGDGGTGKSILALAFSLSISGGICYPNIRSSARAPVLYLDYETTEQEQNDRLGRLCRGMDLSGAMPFHYRRLIRPIVEEAVKIRADMGKYKIGFVVLDSLGPAFGNPNDPELVIRGMNALASFEQATRLVISHVAKADQEKSLGSPYGSVYVRNMARSVWELRGRIDPDGSDEIAIALYHRKANNSKLYLPIGFKIVFSDDKIDIAYHDISESPELLRKAGITFQILKKLKEGQFTVKELSETMSASEGTVRTTLSRLLDQKKVLSIEDYKGKDKKWGLMYNERNNVT